MPMPSPSKVQFTTYISRLAYLLNTHYLEVPGEIVRQLGGSFKIRLVCTINNSLTFQCGLMALGNGRGYISINQKRLKQADLKNGDEVLVALEKDPSRYGLEMAEELAELLKQDFEGMDRFTALAPGKQRYIIHYVSSVKARSCGLIVPFGSLKT